MVGATRRSRWARGPRVPYARGRRVNIEAELPEPSAHPLRAIAVRSSTIRNAGRHGWPCICAALASHGELPIGLVEVGDGLFSAGGLTYIARSRRRNAARTPAGPAALPDRSTARPWPGAQPSSRASSATCWTATSSCAPGTGAVRRHQQTRAVAQGSWRR